MSVFTGHMNCIGKKSKFALLSDAIHMHREHRQNAIQCLNELSLIRDLYRAQIGQGVTPIF